MSALKGMRVAILEARMSGELANLLSRRGAEPYRVPAVRESDIDCADQVGSLIDKLANRSIEFVVFQTGVGVNALLRESEKLGRLDEVTACLQNVTTVCRGPKPAGALKRAGIQVSVGVKAPYTTGDLIEALADLPLSGKGMAVLQYGERNSALLNALARQGATVEDLCLYEWLLPEDTSAMEALISEIMNGEIDAIAFTSQIQVRHLYRVAARNWFSQRQLSDAMNLRAIVAAVGPTCADALRAVDVIPDIVPDHPKMGHMVNALVSYVEERSHKTVSLVS
jgi:uroporphyrinogen-III synthase